MRGQAGARVRLLARDEFPFFVKWGWSRVPDRADSPPSPLDDSVESRVGQRQSGGQSGRKTIEGDKQAHQLGSAESRQTKAVGISIRGVEASRFAPRGVLWCLWRICRLCPRILVTRARAVFCQILWFLVSVFGIPPGVFPKQDIWGGASINTDDPI